MNTIFDELIGSIRGERFNIAVILNKSECYTGLHVYLCTLRCPKFDPNGLGQRNVHRFIREKDSDR